MSISIRTVLAPRESDIGNLVVRRVLPARAARLLGPFIFFDHMGPAVLPSGVGVDVRPHPHIGLATVTYLFEGSLMHRDSIGSKQKIVPRWSPLPPWAEVLWSSGQAKTQTAVDCNASPSRPHESWLRKAFFCNWGNLLAREYA